MLNTFTIGVMFDRYVENIICRSFMFYQTREVKMRSQKARSLSEFSAETAYTSEFSNYQFEIIKNDPSK